MTWTCEESGWYIVLTDEGTKEIWYNVGDKVEINA